MIWQRFIQRRDAGGTDLALFSKAKLMGVKQQIVPMRGFARAMLEASCGFAERAKRQGTIAATRFANRII